MIVPSTAAMAPGSFLIRYPKIIAALTASAPGADCAMGSQIQHFFLCKPVEIFYKFFLH